MDTVPSWADRVAAGVAWLAEQDISIRDLDLDTLDVNDSDGQCPLGQAYGTDWWSAENIVCAQYDWRPGESDFDEWATLNGFQPMSRTADEMGLQREWLRVIAAAQGVRAPSIPFPHDRPENEDEEGDY